MDINISHSVTNFIRNEEESESDESDSSSESESDSEDEEEEEEEEDDNSISAHLPPPVLHIRDIHPIKPSEDDLSLQDQDDLNSPDPNPSPNLPTSNGAKKTRVRDIFYEDIPTFCTDSLLSPFLFSFIYFPIFIIILMKGNQILI